MSMFPITWHYLATLGFIRISAAQPTTGAPSTTYLRNAYLPYVEILTRGERKREPYYITEA